MYLIHSITKPGDGVNKHTWELVNPTDVIGIIPGYAEHIMRPAIVVSSRNHASHFILFVELKSYYILVKCRISHSKHGGGKYGNLEAEILHP